ncbi:MAG: choice-of-anchor tandem repeat GloVer-containing protein, partial [Caulobacteraceae bacterium]
MATLTTLASFNGDNGAHPIYGSLVADQNGDLFGTTLSGGATGDGTVFELVNTGSGYTFQTLASLDYASGSAVFAGLAIDAAGNLFGAAQSGGAAGYGAVFELANTGSGYSLQTLASFSGANGAYPTGGLVADANGNLFGTTQSGGANSQGSVFELVNTGSGYVEQTLVSFDFNDGAAPTGPLITDSHGNLFGTTLQGGSGNVGTVFELVNTGSGYSLQTLATFSGANGSYLYAGLTADAQGDLFGTTYSGGAYGYGTVFELVNTGSGYTFQTLASLDYNTTGGYAMAGVSIDAHGNLFGAALAGGAGGFGTIFELVNTGSGYTLQTVYGFSGSDGAQPKSAPIVDASGNLYGTTAGGGPDGGGTVYEISFGTSQGGGSGEQAALAVTVNGGSGTPIGEAGSTHVGFTVAGMVASDTGTVTFTDQANHTVTVQVIGGQTHYSADFSTLTDGDISASLQVATNAGGDSFTPVAGNTVALDTVAPAQPSAPIDASVTGGYVNAAHDTAAQTISGTAEAGAGVVIYDNGTQVGAVTADNSGAWSWQAGALADGAHSITVTATDLAGNISAASDALAFTVDTTVAQPAAPADASVSNGYVNAAHNTAGQTISGTAEAGASVAIYDNGAQVGAETADGSGAWSYQVGALGDGTSHSFTVTQTDAAGNTSAASDALSFTVDATAPAKPGAPADASEAGGYVNAAHDTADQTIGGAT